MPDFRNPFDVLKNDRLLTHDELVRAIRFMIAAEYEATQLYEQLTFYGANRPGSSVSQGLRDSFWLQAMQSGFIGVLECIKAFSETDFTADLKKFDIPTLILHGDDDQIVPISNSALLSAKLVQSATLKIYSGASHGLCSTHKKQVNTDLLAFIRE